MIVEHSVTCSECNVLSAVMNTDGSFLLSSDGQCSDIYRRIEGPYIYFTNPTALHYHERWSAFNKILPPNGLYVCITVFI